MAEEFYPHGNKLVPYGTPLHTTQVILALLKIVFGSLPDDNPYRFRDTYDDTAILFDVTVNKASNVWGKKPIVIVSRGNQQCGITTMSDLSMLNIPRGNWYGTNLTESSIDIKVISKARGEAEIIGQMIFSYLMTSRVMLPNLCNLHMVSNIMMSPVSKFEQDDECFIVQLTMNYSMQYLWKIIPDYPELQSIGVLINKVNKIMTDGNQ